jgi:hypothetical protein
MRIRRRARKAFAQKTFGVPCWLDSADLDGAESRQLSLMSFVKHGRKSIERGAAAWRRSKILMHRQPDAELELECSRQHALEIGVTPRQRRLAEADSDPRPDRHQLRDVAVRPESRTAPR